MSSLGQTQPAFDPLDEAYSLAPPAEVVEHRPVFNLRDDVAAAEPIGRAPLPPLLPIEAVPAEVVRPATQDSAVAARLSDPSRFTLRNLLWVITLASVVLAVGIRFPRPYFAGAAGIAALATAVSASWLRHSGAVMQLAWWTLLGIYLMACAFAIAGM